MSAPRPGLVLLVVTCIWGSTFVVTKELLRDAPPLLYLALRFGAGALCLLPILARRGAAPLRSRGFLRDALALGALNACGLLFQVFGQVYTTPAKSAFITSLNTPLTALVVLVFYGVVPTRSQRLAVALASLGLILLTWPPPGSQLNAGDLLTVCCAILYAGFIVESARRTPRHDAIAMATVQVVLAASLFGACALGSRLALRVVPAASWPAFLHLEARLFPRGPRVLVEMAYMSIVCVAALMLAQTWALRRLSATTAAVIYAIEPVSATLIAIAVGGASEWPGPRGATGGMLVLFAVYVAEGRRRSAKPKNPSSSMPSSDDDAA